MDRETDTGWQPMDSAPRDGTRILVALSASEQGPAEVDMVRWARPERNAEECWLATDSVVGSPVIYSSSDLSSWMPLPSPMPRLRSRPAGPDETDGSAI